MKIFLVEVSTDDIHSEAEAFKNFDSFIEYLEEERYYQPDEIEDIKSQFEDRKTWGTIPLSVDSQVCSFNVFPKYEVR